MNRLISSFTKFERVFFTVSLLLITISSALNPDFYWLSLIASLVGALSIIFTAKGHILGPIFTIAFAILYGIVSFSFRYYGEMITYLGMTAPAAALSVVAWFKNPYKEDEDTVTEVTVASMKTKEKWFFAFLTIVVTFLFYFILRFFNTANLIPSTISVATSFGASYLTFRRNPTYALAFASNDLVLIVLWILATLENPIYFTMVVCFLVFFANDLYAYHCWVKRKERQELQSTKSQ